MMKIDFYIKLNGEMMLVTVLELSANGDKILFQGLASLSEINDLRRQLLQVTPEHPYISFVIQNNSFFTINMNKVKGINVIVEEDICSVTGPTVE
jgi:hypothetical protein